MVTFEESRKNRRSSNTRRDRFSRRDSGPGRNRSFSDKRDRKFRRSRRDQERTKVICASCGVECEIPFKPRSNKPVYCDNCFSKGNTNNDHKNDDNSGKIDPKDIDIIKRKLNKIMNALNIEKD